MTGGVIRSHQDDNLQTMPTHDSPRSSRRRYQVFVEDYKHRRLDDTIDALKGPKLTGTAPSRRKRAARCPCSGERCAARVASISASICAGSGRIASRSLAVFLLALIAAGHGDDRAAVHAVHHRPRAAERGARHRGAPHRLNLAGATFLAVDRRLEPDRRRSRTTVSGCSTCA